jgi:hypothetical protein
MPISLELPMSLLVGRALLDYKTLAPSASDKEVALRTKVRPHVCAKAPYFEATCTTQNPNQTVDQGSDHVSAHAILRACFDRVRVLERYSEDGYVLGIVWSAAQSASSTD